MQLIDPQTNQPAVMKDEKNKPIKYTIIAKQGYKAPRAVGIGFARRYAAKRFEVKDSNLLWFQPDAKPLTVV